MQCKEPGCSGVKHGSQKHQTSGLRNKQFIIVSIIPRSGTCHTVMLYFLTSFIIKIPQLNEVERATSYTMSLIINKTFLILHNSPHSYHVLWVFYCDILHQSYPAHSKPTSTPSWSWIPRGCPHWLLLFAFGYCSNLITTTIFLISNPHYLQHKLYLSIRGHPQTT